MLGINPEAAVPLANQWNVLRGSADKMAVNKLSGGRLEVKSTIDGAESTEVFGDSDQFKQVMSRYVMVSMMSPKDFGEYELTGMKTAADVAESGAKQKQAEASAKETEALMGPRQQLLEAQAGSAQASAGEAAARTAAIPEAAAADRARAGYYQQEGIKAGVEADIAKATQGDKVAQARATTANIQAQTAQIGEMTPDEFDGVANPVDPEDMALTPGGPGPIPPTRDRSVLFAATQAIKNANERSGIVLTEREAATEMVRARDQLERYGTAMPYDTATGTLILDDGTPVRMPLSTRNSLLGAKQRETAPPP